jgi:hypothetical protein
MAETRRDKQVEPPPVRRGRATAVGSEVNFTAQGAFQRAGFTDPTLILRWQEIAGDGTAALTQPVSLKEGPSGGVLTLRAEPGAAVFLQHDSRALCDRINTYLGRQAVARLRFIQGTLPPRPKPIPRRRSSAAVASADPVQKYQGPEGLRDALLNLARTRRSDP